MAREVRRVEGGRGDQTQDLGAGERPPETDRCGTGARHLDAQGRCQGKLLSPARRRDAVAMLTRKHKVSERRACRLVGQHRSSNRYEPRPTDLEAKLVERMHQLSEEHLKWGYRMIHGLLVAEGWPVNKKRIERLWRSEGLQVPLRKVKGFVKIEGPGLACYPGDSGGPVFQGLIAYGFDKGGSWTNMGGPGDCSWA